MTLASQGYFRDPTLFEDNIVFVCEDDLWKVHVNGGVAQRITSSRSEFRAPMFSPDGRWIACCSREEGEHDLYLMPAEGGMLTRLTFLNGVLYPVAWSADSQNIVFRSTHQAVHRSSDACLYQVSCEGGPVQRLDYGPATALSYEPEGKGVVLGRNTISNSRWKRYRGGMVGEIWVDVSGAGDFKRILQELPGNPIAPRWIGARIYFISDHEGIGNLYSCTPEGADLRQESFQKEFYVRHPATDGSRFVCHVGADLCLMNVQDEPSEQQMSPIPIQWHSQKTSTQRRFVYGDQYLSDVLLNPEGDRVSLISRGKLFCMPLWEQSVCQYGQRDGVRYRSPQWLADGRLSVISDQLQREERLELFDEPALAPEQSISLPSGRVQSLLASPKFSQLVFTNSRLELYLIDLEAEPSQENTDKDSETAPEKASEKDAASKEEIVPEARITRLDSSTIREISDVVFSPDGHWIAYCKHLTLELTAIFLMNLKERVPVQITQPVRYDFAPSFDPDGRWLYFLSSRTYNPIWDTVQTATTFARSIKPYLITLDAKQGNPFWDTPHAPGSQKDNEKEKESEEAEKEKTKTEDSDSNSTDTNKEAANKDSEETEDSDAIKIDLEDITERIIEFPVSESIYGQILGLSNRVIFTEQPLLGSMEEEDDEHAPKSCVLWMYDFEKQERELLAPSVDYIQINDSAKTLLYESEGKIRVIEAGVIPPEASESSSHSRKSGWIDLSRVRVSVNYQKEWQQMFCEAWRLQKEFFWTENLSGVDWEQVYQRYEPLLARVASRSELSDLIWEMQGELGTSHAYEYGGEYPFLAHYPVGKLGADIEYSKEKKAWFFSHIYKGDIWKKEEHSPLAEPGIPVKEGDHLLAIGGVPLDEHTTPEELLVHQAGEWVMLSVQASESDSKEEGKKQEAETLHIEVQTMHSDQAARYREWVNQNQKKVSDATDGRIGYLHIPDMHVAGIAEFHRGYLSQVNKEGLIIDVRYNAGGMVSPLILEKLAHRHLGYDVPRWGEPESYPVHTIRGHLIALTNQFAGSDGDMFSYSFRHLELGKLVGKRTWGGVIGIDEGYPMVDGTTTTQPQYSIWFHKDGWAVENYGVEPDIVVEDPPQAYKNTQDPQLQRAIEEMLQLLKDEPIHPVQFSPAPLKPLPK